MLPLPAFICNKYVKWLLILCTSYIIVHAVGRPLNRCDFIFVIYLLSLKDIDENSAMKLALVFGIFYDLNFQFYLGSGTLLFLLMNFVKVQVYMAIKMGRWYSQLIYIISINTLYTLTTLIYLGYPASLYPDILGYYLANNLIALFTIYLLLEGRRAVSHSKR